MLQKYDDLKQQFNIYYLTQFLWFKNFGTAELSGYGSVCLLRVTEVIWRLD